MKTTEDEQRPLLGINARIDLRAVAFPSDEIKLGLIRQRHPADFDTLGLGFFDGERMGKPRNDWPQQALADLIHNERLLAQRVFESAVRGDREPAFSSPHDDDERCVLDEMEKHYIFYGMAQGPYEARLLIQSIESQAISQARAFKSRVRGRSR